MTMTDMKKNLPLVGGHWQEGSYSACESCFWKINHPERCGTCVAKYENMKNDSTTKTMDFIQLMGGHIDDSLVRWLVEVGFFTAPASVSHHANHSGGLYLHSLEVMRQLLWLTEELGLKWQKERSPFIVGMFHDICKVDNYRHVEGDDAEAWEYNNASLLPGHGEKSVILLQQHMQLTDEELYCIRWHMGAFDDDKKNWNSYGRAVTKFPNVLYTHTADMIAARIVGV